ncbi:alpha-L-fucosidase [Leifsonia sp. McL0607]|uniref:alpha-L-fucosidase n=1 Tax=Leifsonia sp. McL0607 TaxID=3415672 RepID=UPI003CE855E3
MIIKPTARQLAWQSREFGIFLHFGLNTFHGKEWSDGTLPASSFDPGELDAREWADAAVELGADYVVLTAKHHDGFCLWPTQTTDYSVASSPWRDGRGDVVAELAEACREVGLGLGLYLSPWDRNAECYPDPERYSDFYVRQLTELCTRYGPLVELWFDGAGSEGYEYDWKRIMAVVNEHQPDAMVFNMGAPTIRWVGNENGLAADPVEYVVRETQLSNYTIVTIDSGGSLYLPPECDVSVRRGWFWHPEDEPKDVEHLLAIHYGSIGMGANLLLNIPPDRSGRLDSRDLAVLREWRAELDRRFAEPIEAELVRTDCGWEARFGREVTIDHLLLREELGDGQRITAHRLLDGGETVADGLTVGAGRLHAFQPRVVRSLAVEADGDVPRLASVTAYRTGHTNIPQPPAGYLAPTTPPES